MTSYPSYPCDSADARELREREPDQPPLHDSRCDSGWLGEDDAGRPIPCPQCRPHLTGDRCDGCGADQMGCSVKTGLAGRPCCGHGGAR